MHHYLSAKPDALRWGHIDPAAPPALRIASGDSVTIETLSGGPRNLPPPGSPHSPLSAHLEAIAALVPELGPHLLTGPIHVEGAEQGDRLLVEIEEVRLTQDWAWNAVEPGFGLFPDLAPAYESLIVPLDQEAGTARLPWGPTVSIAPFFGILAVAPTADQGRVSSVPPGLHGGNVDCRLFCQGATITFPVFTAGALFHAGDGHALQGEGEICDTALETALTGRFRFTLEKGAAPEAPEVECGHDLATFGFDSSLDIAARQATTRMLDRICRSTPLTRIEAYRHISLCGDLRITQVVNGQKGVHCLLDRRSLGEIMPAG